MHSERQRTGRAASAGEVTRRGLGWIGAALVAVACKTPAKVEASASGDAAAMADSSTSTTDAGVEAAVGEPARSIGPHEVAFEGGRKVYYVVPPRVGGTHRLIANLHGVCNPPGYSCGYWVQAAASVGFLVCPEGNSHCGGPQGPPTWTEPIPKMDVDLEKAIATVDANHPGEISREGSVLTAFSLGAYAAAQIAKDHPGRWPYLILIEANVALDVASLRASGVRAVALVAGEIGSQVAGERATAQRLVKQGFPARLWVMKGAGHHYSGDIDTIMAEALAFVLSEGGDAFKHDGASTTDAGAAR
jgi:hypothetical protein